MNKRFLLFVLIASVAFGAVDSNKPIPKLALKDGRHLENVIFVSYSPTAVMARWDGGRGTIAYDALPAEIGEIAKAMRPNPSTYTRQSEPAGVTKSIPGPEKAKQSPAKDRTISGQVFVTTRGAGAYRFADATVIAYPSSLLSAVLEKVKNELSNAATARMSSQSTPTNEWLIAWSKSARETGLEPIASTQTNADGEYVLSIPSREDVFLFCYTTRQVGGKTEQNRWIVPTGNSRKVDLTGSNQF